MTDRRAHTDRRRKSDRRRQSDDRFVALEICHSAVRMALVQRGTPPDLPTVVTRTIAWRHQASCLYSKTAADELAGAIRKLVSEEKIDGARLRVALGGPFCVTRVVSGPAERVRNETSQLEERSQLYLSLGPGPKAIAGFVEQTDARHQHALLAVANQKTIDLLVEVAGAAGVAIESIEPSLVALSRVAKQIETPEEEPVLVIHLDEMSIELGICHQGRLLVDYRPGGRSAPSDAAEVLKQHLPRLQRYCNRNYRSLKAPLRRVIVCGERDKVAEALQSFEAIDDLTATDISLSCLATHWTYPDEAPQGEMAAALGTALTFQDNENADGGPNLMAGLIAQMRESIRPILLRSLAPIAAVLLVATTLFLLTIRLDRENQALQSKIDSLAPLQAQTFELRLTWRRLENRLSNLRRIESALPQQSWSDLMSLVGACMPNDVWLDELTVQDSHGVKLAGGSFADAGIYEFTRWLEKAPGLANVSLGGTQSSRAIEGPATSFNIDFTLANFDDHDEHETEQN